MEVPLVAYLVTSLIDWAQVRTKANPNVKGIVMTRFASVLTLGAALLIQAACTNPVLTAEPTEPRFNGGSMGSGGRTGDDPGVSAASTEDGARMGTCYEEDLTGGSMGSGGRVIVPCPIPAT
jgi:hypothetical protein